MKSYYEQYWSLWERLTDSDRSLICGQYFEQHRNNTKCWDEEIFKEECKVLSYMISKQIHIGCRYKHFKNDLLFTPIMVVNQASTNPNYPMTVVYVGLNGNTWAKTLDNWNETMILEENDFTK